MIAGVLHTKIEAVCPISSVSLGRIDDKKTWAISFDDKATEKQKADAQIVIDVFNVEIEQARIEKSDSYKQKAIINAAKELAVADRETDVADGFQAELDSIGVSL